MIDKFFERIKIYKEGQKENLFNVYPFEQSFSGLLLVYCFLNLLFVFLLNVFPIYLNYRQYKKACQ